MVIANWYNHPRPSNLFNTKKGILFYILERLVILVQIAYTNICNNMERPSDNCLYCFNPNGKLHL